MASRLKPRRKPVQPGYVLRQRLLLAGLLAFFLQATLPFFLTACPVYAAVEQLVDGQSAPADTAMAMDDMPDDCPMHMAPAGGGQTDSPSKHASCALCDALSPFHGYVAAVPVALPLPAPLWAGEFFPVTDYRAPVFPAASFGARAPPVRA